MHMTKGSSLVLRIYFGVVAAVTLFTLMYGAIDFLTIGLKTFIFTSADVPAYNIVNCESPDASYQYGTRSVPVTKENATGTETLTAEETKARCEASNATMMEQYKTQKANDAVRNLALILVSLPLFVIHFRVVYRDWKNEHNDK